MEAHAEVRTRADHVIKRTLHHRAKKREIVGTIVGSMRDICLIP